MNIFKNTLKPGTLIQLNSTENLLEEEDFPRFCPINSSDGKIRNNMLWEDLVPRGPGTLLLFVESKDYSKEAAAAAVMATAATSAWAADASSLTEVWAAAADASSTSSALSTWEKARKEYETTGKIPGGIFLSPNGQLIWVSHYDLEHFEEVTTSK